MNTHFLIMIRSRNPFCEKQIPEVRMSVVFEAMNPHPVIIYPDETVKKAASLMSTGNIGILCITENGTLTGVISERDLVTRVMAECTDLSMLNQPIRKYMTANPVTVSAFTPIDDCLRLFLEKGFRHLPVTDNQKKVIGILSMRNFMPYLRGKMNNIFNSENYKLFLQELEELDLKSEQTHKLDTKA
jgi:CBS domain-containing protein